ncbi:MAG TPA: APC family permease [Streptosporangiaceae bacterium]|nr:APC family permease [Streptosporangiaceae bacterium]
MAEQATAQAAADPVLKRNLHVWEAIGLSVGAMSPALAMSFSGPGVAGLVGRGAALSFVFASVTCCLIGYGYVLLTRKYNHAGSIYGFVGASLGPRLGVFSGWAMSLMYFVFVPASAAASGYFLGGVLDDIGWWHNPDWIWLALPITLILWAFAAGLIKRSTRALLYIEAVTVTLILVLMVFIVVKVGQGHGLNGGTLTGSIFTLPSGVNLHALILGSVFGFLAFAGFEGAGALGEEAENPQRAIPRAIGSSVLALAVFYIACIAVQSLGFGATTAGSSSFASSSGPLFQLAGVYVGDPMRNLIELGAAFSAFGAGLGAAVAGARLIYGMARDGAPRSPLARVSAKSGAPRPAVLLVMGADVVCLIILRILGATGLEVWQYLGTLGTLAILVGYGLVNAGATRAVFDSSLGVARWRGVLPAIAVILCAYVLYANVYPAPAAPFNLFPYILIGWLVVGAAVILATPALVQRVGLGLATDLDLPAGRVAAEALPSDSGLPPSAPAD